MKLEVAMLVGSESKQFLVDLTKLIERMEAAAGGKKKKVEATDDDDEPVDDSGDDDEEKAPKKKAGKKAAAADEDDDSDTDEETESATDDADDEEEKPAKKKAKKVTLDDVNDACKARAAGGKRKEVLKILKKNFGVETVSDLESDQYGAVIKAMAVEDEE